MVEYTIRLIGGEKEGTARVTCEARDRFCYLTICYGENQIEESASDYFTALCQARVRLEKEGLDLFCYGSSLNVRPSGMSRDMGGGMKAYRLTIGRKPLITDLVGIFEAGPDVKPATVAKQNEYFDEWRKSAKV